MPDPVRDMGRSSGPRIISVMPSGGDARNESADVAGDLSCDIPACADACAETCDVYASESVSTANVARAPTPVRARKNPQRQALVVELEDMGDG